MQARHTDRSQYFKEQGETTKKYVIPYIDEVKKVTPAMRVLEVGCGEGGNMMPFLDMGCECVGVDIDEPRLELGRTYFADHPNVNKLTLTASDIYKVDATVLGTFDLIMLRDVIEHLPNQEVIMEIFKKFLKPDGIIFFGFPPWRMPFGGHQQVLGHKIASKLPYYHILPGFMYYGMLRMFGEREWIPVLREVKETRISIARFHRIIKKLNYKIRKETYYLINPNYEVKFNLKQRTVLPVFRIPFVCDFYTTCLYCIISR